MSTRLPYTQRLTAVLGTASAIAVPFAGEAAIVHVTDRPLVMALHGPVGEMLAWDIDGDTVPEFELFRDSYGMVSTFPSGRFSYRLLGVLLGSVTSFSAPLNGRGLVAPPTSLTNDPLGEDDAQALPANFLVGPTLANNYTWGRTGERFRELMYHGTAYYQQTMLGTFTSHYDGIGYDLDYGFVPGLNRFGFRFDAGNGLQYGWGILDLDFTPGAETVRITQWHYSSTPGEAVDVSEPAAVLPSLALLGLGAAGLRRWRDRKDAA